MAIETTHHGYQKPDGNEPFRNGDNVIANNAQKAEDDISRVEGRIGLAEAAINAGAGGPGLSADPVNAGLYYFAGTAFAVDPLNPGLYLFEEATP